MREYYEKLPNGTFKPIGVEFSGFPSNGIWQVLDGRQNCIIPLSDDPYPSIPHISIPILCLQDDIVSSLPSPCSLGDAVRHTLLYIARTQPTTYPELQL